MDDDVSGRRRGLPVSRLDNISLDRQATRIKDRPAGPVGLRPSVLPP
jgi:hypothetical protein